MLHHASGSKTEVMRFSGGGVIVMLFMFFLSNQLRVKGVMFPGFSRKLEMMNICGGSFKAVWKDLSM